MWHLNDTDGRMCSIMIFLSLPLSAEHRFEVRGDNWSTSKPSIKTRRKELFLKTVRTHSYTPTSCLSLPEFMDHMPTGAQGDSAWGLWRNRVGKNGANDTAAPPSLPASLQKVSFMVWTFFYPIFNLDNAFSCFLMYSNGIKASPSVFELVCPPAVLFDDYLLCMYTLLMPLELL